MATYGQYFRLDALAKPRYLEDFSPGGGEGSG